MTGNPLFVAGTIGTSGDAEMVFPVYLLLSI